MAKLLLAPHFPSVHRHTTYSIKCLPACFPHFSVAPLLKKPHSFLQHTRHISARAFDADGSEKVTNESAKQEARNEGIDDSGSNSSRGGEEKYPSGEFLFEGYDMLESLAVKFKMLIAWPWERVKKGSVLTMKIRGEVSDQLKSRFSSGLSLPKLCENFIKAAYDPRISGIYLHIEPLNCGWGKIEEMRRHVLDFKKSGKFIVGYVPVCGEKEYYLGCACDELYAPPSAYFQLYGLTVQASFLGGVLEKVGIEPQVQRIGKYKSAGDQLTRKSISKENREMLTTLLDNIYANWVDTISLAKGKKKEDVENFINEGVYMVERLKEEGWITDTKYDDEVISMLKERLGVPSSKTLPTVDYRTYCRVRRWTLGLTGYRNQIAIIRASGSISRARGPLSSSSSGIVSEKFIEKIHSVRDSKRYKALVLRIDSPGGDALASDLMWREIKLLAASKPVVASMGDVAASGGYYMAMGADTIVAENLTLTGSIGVVTGKFNLEKLYERIGFNKVIISRGRYAELTAAEQRPFSQCSKWRSRRPPRQRLGGRRPSTAPPKHEAAVLGGPSYTAVGRRSRAAGRRSRRVGAASRRDRADEAELFAKSAENAYKSFRDKAASSRCMTVEKMEEVAQGRVWTGNDAATRGLVDAIGGVSRAVAIAKQKANLPLDQQVTLVELSTPSTSPLDIISGFGNSLVEADKGIKELLQIMASSDGIQARMDGIMFENFSGPVSSISFVFTFIKDYLRSLY